MHLITGASGQVGSALYRRLVQLYGADQVLATDIVDDANFERYTRLDITDQDAIGRVYSQYRITHVYHLAAILSAKAEANPKHAWDVNMSGLLNILSAGVEYQIDRMFFPSSIAVFGTDTYLGMVHQHDVQHPLTQYGISKSAGENWCQYYHEQYQLDVRSIRYPGVIGPNNLPGGGTTDYAVHIFHQLLQHGRYEVYLEPTTTMPMIYMDDAIEATIRIMQASAASIQVRTSYNIQAMSFSPEELFDEIAKHLPDASVSYKPDERQKIAAHWPHRLDDIDARMHWAWYPTYDMPAMVKDMINHLSVNV